MTQAQTFILAPSRESARRLAALWACGKLPPMADDLDSAEALRHLHPRPLRYGLAIWVAKSPNSRLDPVSVDLVRSSELSQMNFGRIRFQTPSPEWLEMLEALERDRQTIYDAFKL